MIQMPVHATTRSAHRNIHARERASGEPTTGRARTSRQTSNIRIRTTPGRAPASHSQADTRGYKKLDEGDPAETRAVPIDSPARRQQKAITPSTAEMDSKQERSGRLVRRSRRWVQLRSTTTRAVDAAGAETTQAGSDAAPDNANKPEIVRHPATTALPGRHEGPSIDTRRNRVVAGEVPVEAGQPFNSICYQDPLGLLVELALLPTRMTLAATTETLRALTSREDCNSRLAIGWDRRGASV
jgi:hypothetical protein